MPTVSRRTSKRTIKTYAGRVVYDRKEHRFKIKDVIRIARKADFSGSTPEIVAKLVGVTFALIVNAYTTVFANSTRQLELLLELFNAIRLLVGGIQLALIQYGIDAVEQFIKYLLLNYAFPSKKRD